MARRPLLPSPPPPRPLRADSSVIVQSILVAAIELGPQATLAEIAERAGVGTASLHRYFPSTSALFAEITRQMFRTLLDQVGAVLRRSDLDVRGAVEAICRIALDGPNVSMEFRRRLNLDVPPAWTIDVVEATYAELVHELVAWLRRKLTHPPADLETRVFVAFAAVRGANLLALVFPHLAPSHDALLDQMVSTVMSTLIADTTPRDAALLRGVEVTASDPSVSLAQSAGSRFVDASTKVD
jgi:AcrR family transcriptional regulator